MGRRDRERRLRIEQGLEQPRSLLERSGEVLLDRLKVKFLRTIEDGGVRETERLIASGKIEKSVPVDVEKELADAKVKIGSKADVLGVTDDDLREVIRTVARKCSLEVKNGTV